MDLDPGALAHSRGRSMAMLCPVDQTPLTISDRQGVEIDFCPTCRGVWLDRGELDKILDRSADLFNRAERGHRGPPPPMSGPYGQQQPYGYRGSPKKRRKGFLDDIFDFD